MTTGCSMTTGASTAGTLLGGLGPFDYINFCSTVELGASATIAQS